MAANETKTRASSSQSFLKVSTSKLGEVPELLEARVDLFAGESTETIHTKLLAAEAPHDGTVDHSTADLFGADVTRFQIDALFGQIADEAAGEAIARARWIEHFFEQVSGNHEVRV